MKTNYLNVSSLFFLLLILSIVFISQGCSNEEEEKKNPNISEVTSSDCKHFQKVVLDSITSSDDCIEYSYDGISVLSIKHLNAGFNCCPEKISADFEISGDTIKILESEKSSLCDCNCLYDLEYTIKNIAPKNYFIKVVEPYATQGEKLEFQADLHHSNIGTYCVERDYYPWGF
ncbi:MAG: hypothetical protein V1720_04640 [bacterium]